MCLFVCTVDAGVIEEEPIEEFDEQYREPKSEEPYRDQEICDIPKIYRIKSRAKIFLFKKFIVEFKPS